MIETWRVALPQRTGEKTRNAYVYVPDSLAPGERCPVLYMFDGHNVFFDDHATYGRSWRMGEWLDRRQTKLIAAAVECDHSPDGGRLSEYSPFSFSERSLGEIEGRGRGTMEWFTRVFKPEIDRRWPTKPGRADTMIAGSSMGGLMSLYALFQYNHVFSRAAALSPSIWVAPEKLKSLVAHAKVRQDTVLYMDYGSREMGNHTGMRRDFGAFGAKVLNRGVHLTMRIVPGGTHSEASWERQLPFVMETLFYGLDDAHESNN